MKYLAILLALAVYLHVHTLLSLKFRPIMKYIVAHTFSQIYKTWYSINFPAMHDITIVLLLLYLYHGETVNPGKHTSLHDANVAK